MLHRFNIAGCHPRRAPADEAHIRLTFLMSPKNDHEKQSVSSRPYRELIGSLSYAANSSKPDISYSVNQLAQFSSNPGKGHWAAAKRILAYLAGTVNYGLFFLNGSKLIGFTYSDYASDID